MSRKRADLTDKEVADALGVHPRTVQRRCKAGAFPGAAKSGRSWRIPESALDAYTRAAVQRAMRGPLAEAVEEIDVLSKRLQRASAFIDGADADTLRDLMTSLDRLQASVKGIGGAALERRRRFERTPPKRQR